MRNLKETLSLCPECTAFLKASVFEDAGKVWIEKTCKEHGKFRELYWGDSEMYKKAESFGKEGKPVQNPNTKIEKSCPKDCGLCSEHKGHTALANIVVTNRCDLNCWYCFFFAEKAGYVFEPTLEQIKEMAQNLRNEKPIPCNAAQLSLDYNELIYLKDSKGNIFSKKIGEFVDNQMKEISPLVKSEPIEHEIADVNSFEALSIDGSLAPTFMPLKSVIRHKAKEDLFNIKTDCGWEINCTGAHSVFVLGESSIETKPVSELSEKDILLGPLVFPDSNALSEIDLLGLIEKNSPGSLSKIMLGPFSKEQIKGFEAIEERRIAWDFVNYSVFKKSNCEKPVFIRYFNSKKGKELPTKFKISPELIRLLGYYIGEGCAYRSGIIFTFGLHEDTLINDLVFCVKKIFGETSIRKRTVHGSAVQLYVEGYLYKLFFEVLGCGKKAVEKSVPHIIFNVSSELKKEFLRTYFRCDGNARMRSSGYEIDHNTASKRLASELIALNLQLGLVSKIEKSITKPRLVSKTGQFISSSSLKYKVVIGGKENLFNALWYFDCDANRQKKFLEYALKEEKHAPSYARVPSLLVRKLADCKIKDKKIAYLIRRVKFDKSVLKQNLAKIINYFSANNIAFDSFFNDISHSKIGFFKIRKISRVKPSSEYVYDVSVPGSQAFFAGLGMLLAHNTGGEPTMRPDLIEIIRIVKENGIEHVQLNTDGINLAVKPKLAAEVRGAGVNTVYLSFDGVTEKTNPKNHWEIPKAMENCRKAGLGIVLVPTIINSINDNEVGDILRFGFQNIDIIRAVNFQPVSLVGRMPQKKREQFRITIPDVIKRIEAQTAGEISREDFYPVPIVLPLSRFIEQMTKKPQYELSSHFACGMGTYVFKDSNKMIPITRFLDVPGLIEFLDEKAAELESGKSKLWIGAGLLFKFNSFIDKSKSPKELNFGKILFDVFIKHDYDALGVFHKKSMFIGMMHFMDLYNYDIERVKNCCIHYATPSKEMPIVPFCAFNVIPELYRDKIQKEFGLPIKEWEQKYGRKLTDDLYRRGLHKQKIEAEKQKAGIKVPTRLGK